jgi:hypothetical protein
MAVIWCAFYILCKEIGKQVIRQVDRCKWLATMGRRVSALRVASVALIPNDAAEARGGPGGGPGVVPGRGPCLRIHNRPKSIGGHKVIYLATSGD